MMVVRSEFFNFLCFVRVWKHTHTHSKQRLKFLFSFTEWIHCRFSKRLSFSDALSGFAFPTHPQRGMLERSDGQRRLLSAVSFTGCMSHPAALLALFGTPTRHHVEQHSNPTNKQCTHNPVCSSYLPVVFIPSTWSRSWSASLPHNLQCSGTYVYSRGFVTTVSY